MNSQLKDNVYDVPADVIQKISVTVANLKQSDSHGVQRAKNILKTKKVTYGQLKRIIHDLKNIDKVADKVRYDLYGGELMEKWANTFLDGERTQLTNKKTASKNLNSLTGMNNFRKNQFIKKHEKKETTKNPVNMLKHNSEKNSVSGISSVGLFEEVERMKKIINY